MTHENWINATKEILEKERPARLYHIGEGYAPGVCLNQEESGIWECCTVMNGQRENTRYYIHIQEAILHLLEQLYPGQLTQWLRIYRRILEKVEEEEKEK